jgi:hypothetical protein
MFRGMTALISMAALAGPVFADDPVSIGPIQFGEELLEKADDYGERELERLAGYLRDDLERELAGHLGEGGLTLNVTILDADPNRPTPAQMSGPRGLHHSSYSLGGADLEAELVDASGTVVESYGYSWQSFNLEMAAGRSRWTDAKRTFDRFADQIGDSLNERSDAGS